MANSTWSRSQAVTIMRKGHPFDCPDGRIGMLMPIARAAGIASHPYLWSKNLNGKFEELKIECRDQHGRAWDVGYQISSTSNKVTRIFPTDAQIEKRLSREEPRGDIYDDYQFQDAPNSRRAIAAMAQGQAPDGAD